VPEPLGPANEDDMVLEFVRSEVDSPRFNKFYPDDIAGREALRSRLVDNADVHNATDNARRRELLAYRGYTTRTGLFDGFPRAVAWRWERWTPAELERMRYAKLTDTEVWRHLSSSTRLVGAAARNLEAERLEHLLGKPEIPPPVRVRMSEIAEQIRSVAALHEQGRTFPRAIVVTDGREVVVLEGHVRTTAFVLARADRPIEMLVGRSPEMFRWLLF
jgi:hypothetical protein